MKHPLPFYGSFHFTTNLLQRISPYNKPLAENVTYDKPLAEGDFFWEEILLGCDGHVGVEYIVDSVDEVYCSANVVER